MEMPEQGSPAQTQGPVAVETVHLPGLTVQLHRPDREPEPRLGQLHNPLRILSPRHGPVEGGQQTPEQAPRFGLGMPAVPPCAPLGAQGRGQIDRTHRSSIHPVHPKPHLGPAHLISPQPQPRQQASHFAALQKQVVGPLDAGLKAEPLQLQGHPDSHRQAEGRPIPCRPGHGGAEPHPTRGSQPDPSTLTMAMALVTGHHRQPLAGGHGGGTTGQQPALQFALGAGTHRQPP